MMIELAFYFFGFATGYMAKWIWKKTHSSP